MGLLSSWRMGCGAAPMPRTPWTRGTISTWPLPAEGMLGAEAPPEKVGHRQDEQDHDDLPEAPLIEARAQGDAADHREQRRNEPGHTESDDVRCVETQQRVSDELHDRVQLED